MLEVERRTTTSAEERSALGRFRDFALGVGRDVLVSVLSAYADRTCAATRELGGRARRTPSTTGDLGLVRTWISSGRSARLESVFVGAGTFQSRSWC